MNAFADMAAQLRGERPAWPEDDGCPPPLPDEAYSGEFDRRDSAPAQAEPERTSTFYSAASLKGKPVPARQWLVPGMVPQKTVTLFSGDGGTGKSLLALQLAVAVAGGDRWLGREVAHGGSSSRTPPISKSSRARAGRSTAARPASCWPTKSTSGRAATSGRP